MPLIYVIVHSSRVIIGYNLTLYLYIYTNTLCNTTIKYILYIYILYNAYSNNVYFVFKKDRKVNSEWSTRPLYCTGLDVDVWLQSPWFANCCKVCMQNRSKA